MRKIRGGAEYVNYYKMTPYQMSILTKEQLEKAKSEADEEERLSNIKDEEIMKQEKKEKEEAQYQHLLNYMKNNYEMVKNNENFETNKEYYTLEKTAAGIWMPSRRLCKTPEGKKCSLCKTEPSKENECIQVDLNILERPTIWRKKRLATFLRGESASKYDPTLFFRYRQGGKSKRKQSKRKQSKRKSNKKRKTRRHYKK